MRTSTDSSIFVPIYLFQEIVILIRLDINISNLIANIQVFGNFNQERTLKIEYEHVAT